MTRITINTDLGGNKAGATIDTTEGAAALLIEGGYAEQADAPKGAPRGKAKPAAETPENEGGGDSPEDPAFTAG